LDSIAIMTTLWLKPFARGLSEAPLFLSGHTGPKVWLLQVGSYCCKKIDATVLVTKNARHPHWAEAAVASILRGPRDAIKPATGRPQSLRVHLPRPFVTYSLSLPHTHFKNSFLPSQLVTDMFYFSFRRVSIATICLWAAVISLCTAPGMSLCSLHWYFTRLTLIIRASRRTPHPWCS
jgi:hypothetical protein